MCRMAPELAHAADRTRPRGARCADQGGPRRGRAHPARAGRQRRLGGLPLAHRERPAAPEHRAARDPRRQARRDRRVPRPRRGLGGRQPARAAARPRRAVPGGGEGDNALALAREALGSPGLQAVPRWRRSAPATSRRRRSTRSATRRRSPAFQAAPRRCEPTPVIRAQGRHRAVPASGASRASSSAPSPCAQTAARRPSRRRCSAPRRASGSSVTLAAALFMAGRTEEAAELCDRAIAESERLSSPVARASAYWNASVIRAESGDVAEALPLAKRALHLLENTERVRDIGRLRTQLSSIMLRTDPPRARGRPGAAAARRHRARLERGQPRRPGPQRPGNAQALLLEGDATEAARAARSRCSRPPATQLPLIARGRPDRCSGRSPGARGEREEAQQLVPPRDRDPDRRRRRPRGRARSGSSSAPWPPRPGWSPRPPTPSSGPRPRPASRARLPVVNTAARVVAAHHAGARAGRSAAGHRHPAGVLAPTTPRSHPAAWSDAASLSAACSGVGSSTLPELRPSRGGEPCRATDPRSAPSSRMTPPSSTRRSARRAASPRPTTASPRTASCARPSTCSSRWAWSSSTASRTAGRPRTRPASSPGSSPR